MVAHEEEEAHLLPDIDPKINKTRASTDSISSASTTSLVFERIDQLVHLKIDGTKSQLGGQHPPESDSRLYADDVEGSIHRRSLGDDDNDDFDHETGPFIRSTKAADKKFRRLIWLIAAIFIGTWAVAFFVYIGRQASRQATEYSNELSGTHFRGNGKKITMEQVQSGQWRPQKDEISWIEGLHGEDGLLLERGTSQKGYLVVEDVRGRNASESNTLATQILMKDGPFKYGGLDLTPSKLWPSKDLKKVLIATNDKSNWRHSFYAQYWIFDVDTQEAQPLDPTDLDGRVQLASWSPQSDAVVFTRDNNMYLRKLSSQAVIQITKDGGPELFYGVPDWVYEEEVFSGNSATWWSEDGKHIAFLRTDESAVPEYPVQYFLSRPSGKKPLPGEENYPEVREIKYPKAGAPNPTVKLQFFDVEKGDVFEVKISDEFGDEDRLITEVVWAGLTGKVLIRETNRESDILRVILVDVLRRTGTTVRTVNIAELDGGWFEVSQNTRFIPSDPSNGRPLDGYIDTVIHDNYDHLGYFTPLDNPNPILLTSGNWEVVNAPSTVDLKNNLVYFVTTKESPIQRHVYSVKLDGTDLQPLTDTSKEGYYGVSFSSGASYALLSYDGPNIPWQRVISTRSNANHFEHVIQNNEQLADMAKKHDLPTKIFSTVNIEGYELQVVERRPSHFDENRKYPVLFYLYGGPGSQMVNKVFTVDFQSYIASNLGYIVVTVDGRGTGFIGREARCIIRGNLGYWESRDQIETAKIWAKKKYVDESRMAIWGWSYGGFMTLKTLEQDAGQTFSYGMAVAPVTDWRFYDSIYTERYMHTPQHNLGGYENSTISNMTALQQNVRFLLMHGVADDNVHMQNSLTLLDKLDLAGVENYDVHIFPDSDHSIYFHNANKIVFDSKSNSRNLLKRDGMKLNFRRAQ
jgi:dipeptidyl aminopeptidase B